MKRFLLLIITAFCFSSCDFSDYILKSEYDFTTTFEKSEGKKTATYPEVIQYYEDLSAVYSSVKVEEMGETDSGLPLHLAIFSSNGDFDLENLRKDHSILFINNGIHPGESDGIDATMMLFRDLAQDSIPVPENTVIVTIPVYNIGGALNRNTGTRTNQNGPESYGFRGNARNYDLNRDFIKADTKNTRSFYEIFHYVKPDVFIDTHVSNGADYQYSLTHLFTQHNKLGGDLGKYLHQDLMPGLKQSLEEKDWDITPYVNVFNEVPEKGFSQFMDHPRYSTGYAALWNTLSMMVETHMLKPYDQRVWGTYELLRSMIELTDEDSESIRKLRAAANDSFRRKNVYEFNFEADSSRVTRLQFKGYEGEMIKSEVTGYERLRYNRDAPFTKEVDYYNNFVATRQVEIPRAYILPQAWWEVRELLELNGVEMTALEKDTVMTAQVYRIEDYKTSQSAYEGHYPHSETRVSSSRRNVKLRRGDFLIPTDQPAIRYILETLEPEAVDSFFNWNFFDSVLQQKEHFSPYVFEDMALQLLEENPDMEDAFEDLKDSLPEFRNSWYAQLDWIHKQSKHYEPTHLRYPVYRLPR